MSELDFLIQVDRMLPEVATGMTIDTIDYEQGIGNGPINPLHLCPKPNTFSM